MSSSINCTTSAMVKRDPLWTRLGLRRKSERTTLPASSHRENCSVAVRQLQLRQTCSRCQHEVTLQQPLYLNIERYYGCMERFQQTNQTNQTISLGWGRVVVPGWLVTLSQMWDNVTNVFLGLGAQNVFSLGLVAQNVFSFRVSIRGGGFSRSEWVTADTKFRHEPFPKWNLIITCNNSMNRME